VRNAYVFYAIEHELQHYKHKTANPKGGSVEQKLYAYSLLQSLEDGFESGNPSHHIAHHTEFPDEAKADYDACRETMILLITKYKFSNEDFVKIKDFLAEQSTKLLVENTGKTKNIPSPDEYLNQFIKDRIIRRYPILSDTEKERVSIFLKFYDNIPVQDSVQNQQE